MAAFLLVHLLPGVDPSSDQCVQAAAGGTSSSEVLTSVVSTHYTDLPATESSERNANSKQIPKFESLIFQTRLIREMDFFPLSRAELQGLPSIYPTLFDVCHFILAAIAVRWFLRQLWDQDCFLRSVSTQEGVWCSIHPNSSLCCLAGTSLRLICRFIYCLHLLHLVGK